jgi:hypothetical protein
MGGITPKASAVRKITFCGTGPRLSFEALGMKSMGYEPRLFSASELSSKSISRVTGSITTFSSTVPKRLVVAKISGSASGEMRIILA